MTQQHDHPELANGINMISGKLDAAALDTEHRMTRQETRLESLQEQTNYHMTNHHGNHRVRQIVLPAGIGGGGFGLGWVFAELLKIVT